MLLRALIIDVLVKKYFCHPERSEGSVVRHAFSPCAVCK